MYKDIDFHLNYKFNVSDYIILGGGKFKYIIILKRVIFLIR